MDVTGGLTGLTSVVIGQTVAAAVKSDGTVVTWGYSDAVEATVPDGLTGVASLAAGDSHFYALKTDGTVVAWGANYNDQTTLPAELTVPGNVKAIEARGRGGLALLADGSLRSWGSFTDPGVDNSVPASLDGKNVLAISASGNNNVAVADDGSITVWGLSFGPGSGTEGLVESPPELADAEIAAVTIGGTHAMALVTKVLEVTKASIAGSATVGQTLTGTAATFSGGPGAVTSKWLADGVVIAGADSPTLAVTAALIGKKITYATTATKGGTEPVVSASTPVGPVAADVVASTTTVGAAAGTYGSAAKVTVTVAGAGRPVGGNVTLTGAGAAQSAAVSGGAATFTLNKALAAGTYTMTASYSGGAGLTPSTGTARLTVAKGKSSKPAFKVNKAPTSKKKGKATVTVGAAAGLAKASGKATVTLKSGKTTKKVKVSLSGGKKSISLPKLKKGKWKIQVSYDGDKNYVAQKSKSYNLKIKK